MKKKEIVTLALTTALLMTAHAVPASAASNAPESMSQTGSIQTITPRWESTNVVVPSISISGKQILCRYTFHQKNRRHHPQVPSIWKRKLGMVGHPSPHGRLMELDRLALPKLTPAQWVLHTAPEQLSQLGQTRLMQLLPNAPSKKFRKRLSLFLCLSVIQVNPQNRR